MNTGFIRQITLDHRKFKAKNFTKKLDKYYGLCYYNSCSCGPVVQLVRTLACHARGRRFDPVPDRHTKQTLSFEGVCIYAGIAQAAERILGKDEVTSSNLVISSLYDKKARNYQGFLPDCCI